MKIMMNLLCSATLAVCISGCCGAKCEHQFPPVDEAVASPAVAKTLKSAKIVFSVKGDDLEKYPATETIRIKMPASARFDFQTKDAAYAAGFHNQNTWGYNNQTGIYALNEEENAELRRQIFFLPIELKIKIPYEDAKWVKDEVIDGEDYSCFKTLPKEGAPASLLVWINKKTNLIYKLETSDALNTYITIFKDYKDYDGVKLPSTVYMSDHENGFNALQIESVEWNIPLEDSIFARPAQFKQ